MVGFFVKYYRVMDSSTTKETSRVARVDGLFNDSLRVLGAERAGGGYFYPKVEALLSDELVRQPVASLASEISQHFAEYSRGADLSDIPALRDQLVALGASVKFGPGKEIGFGLDDVERILRDPESAGYVELFPKGQGETALEEARREIVDRSNAAVEIDKGNFGPALALMLKRAVVMADVASTNEGESGDFAKLVRATAYCLISASVLRRAINQRENRE
jgi:hypothetical protein